MFTLDATISPSIPPTSILIPAKNELAKANILGLALETKALENGAPITPASFEKDKVGKLIGEG